MWAKIFALFERFVAKLAPRELPKVSQALTKLFKFDVPAEARGIISAIRKWVGNNPLKATAVVTVLADAGYDVGMGAFESAFNDDTAGSLNAHGGIGVLQAVIEGAKAALAANRGKVTGDGDPNTFDGIKSSEMMSAAGAIKVQLDLVRAGAGYFGSVEAFRKVREAILGVEEESFDLYAAMNR